MHASLSERVYRRFIASTVKIIVDVPATLKAWEHYPEYKPLVIVGTFASHVTLYRGFDGEELSRVLSSGKITGGKYSARPEREYGASWGADEGAIIAWLGREKGSRLGHEAFLAKLNATGKRFLHLDPEIPPIDPNGPPKQERTMQQSRINLGLGASVADVSLNEVDLYSVKDNGGLEPITPSQAKELLESRPKKDVDLRKVHDQLYLGSLYGHQVKVWKKDKTWGVYLIDDNDRQIAGGAPDKDNAIELARLAIRLRPEKPVYTDMSVLEARRKYDKHFEQDEDPNKIRGSFALKPKDKLTVLKGSTKLGIKAYSTALVADVYQRKGEREVLVKLLVDTKPILLYTTHANRLKDPEIALMDSMGRRILVQRKG